MCPTRIIEGLSLSLSFSPWVSDTWVRSLSIFPLTSRPSSLIVQSLDTCLSPPLSNCGPCDEKDGTQKKESKKKKSEARLRNRAVQTLESARAYKTGGDTSARACRAFAGLHEGYVRGHGRKPNHRSAAGHSGRRAFHTQVCNTVYFARTNKSRFSAFWCWVPCGRARTLSLSLLYMPKTRLLKHTHKKKEEKKLQARAQHFARAARSERRRAPARGRALQLAARPGDRRGLQARSRARPGRTYTVN